MPVRLVISGSLVNKPPYHATQARRGIIPVAVLGDPAELAYLEYGSPAHPISPELLPFSGRR